MSGRKTQGTWDLKQDLGITIWRYYKTITLGTITHEKVHIVPEL